MQTSASVGSLRSLGSLLLLGACATSAPAPTAGTDPPDVPALAVTSEPALPEPDATTPTARAPVALDGFQATDAPAPDYEVGDAWVDEDDEHPRQLELGPTKVRVDPIYADGLLSVAVRIEPHGGALVHEREIGGHFCDELQPAIFVLERLDHGAVIDAQLLCSMGEDYRNNHWIHTLIFVPNDGSSPTLLWTGLSQESTAMDNCGDWSSMISRRDGDALVISRSEGVWRSDAWLVDYADLAREQPCEPEPETVVEVERVTLPPAQGS